MNETLKQDILAAAYEIGFALAGVTEPKILLANEFRDWLDHRYAGMMEFLYQNTEKRLDPTLLVPGTKSILSLAVNYYQPLPADVSPAEKNIALCAWGRDYHRVVKNMLHSLAQKISVMIGKPIQYRTFVDSGPLLEKTLAWQAGLGWIGKNALLVNRKYGSFLFLGEIFLDFELPADEPAANGCGECRRCLDACPAKALPRPHVLESRKCITYRTFYQNRDNSEPPKPTAGWLVGCDVCQQVCPFNRSAIKTTIPDFLDHRLRPRIDPAEILKWDKATWADRVSDTNVEYMPLEQWQNNAKAVLDNPRGTPLS
jgi:epoxyqueuosine reductase